MPFLGNWLSLRSSLIVSMLSLASVLYCSPAHSDQGSFNAATSIPSWLPGGAACAAAFERDISQSSRCIASYAGGLLASKVAPLASEQGRAIFGREFRVVNRLSSLPNGQGLSGNLDAIIPLVSSGSVTTLAEGQKKANYTSALFLQHGLTTWVDGAGFRRNDLRLGTVYRHAFSETEIFGLSALLQENLERGHQRLAAGVDYSGRWGSGWLQHFLPVTGWRPSRAGYEERALGGTELGLRMELTNTLSANASVARWEAEGDEIDRSLDGRLGFVWQPHPWLSFNAVWEPDSVRKEGKRGNVSLLHAEFKFPFGNVGALPRWEGLGKLGVSAKPRDIWKPVDSVDRIRVVERTISFSDPRPQSGGVSVRFLQSSASSGDEISVEVTLSSPAPHDTVVEVRLVPGSGSSPAIPGIDYVDEPVEIIVLSGSTVGRATIRLIANDDLIAPRILAVTASLLS